MKFKIKFGSSGKKHPKGEILASLGRGWQKVHKYLFFAILISTVVFGFFIWQRSFSGNSWSAEKKQEYLNSRAKGVVLNEVNYKKVIADMELRKNSGINGQQSLKDIFFESSAP